MLSRRQIGMLSAAVLVGACSNKPTTVYVIRHAEKAVPSKGDDPTMMGEDPELTDEGRARAAALPAALGGAKLTAVYSSPYKRTLDTVAPLAKQQHLEVQTVAAKDIDGLIAKIRALGAGSAALVCGHSNTVPMIIAALGVKEKVELGHDDHGDLFVVTLGSKVTLERRRFDP